MTDGEVSRVRLSRAEEEVRTRYLRFERTTISNPSDRPEVGCACPAASFDIADSVFGRYDESVGRFQFFPEKLPLPPVLVRELSEEDFQLRARLSGRCATSSCMNWTGDTCYLGEVVAAVSESMPESDGSSLQCPIKGDCRWHRENGDRACVVCPQLRNLEF